MSATEVRLEGLKIVLNKKAICWLDNNNLAHWGSLMGASWPYGTGSRAPSGTYLLGTKPAGIMAGCLLKWRNTGDAVLMLLKDMHDKEFFV